jgi:hypothetical protein
MLSESLAKYFKGFGKGCTKLHAKLDGNLSLDYASIPDKTKPVVEKALVLKKVHVHNKILCGGLMQ